MFEMTAPDNALAPALTRLNNPGPLTFFGSWNGGGMYGAPLAA
jgi:hypothetical protein